MSSKKKSKLEDSDSDSGPDDRTPAKKKQKGSDKASSSGGNDEDSNMFKLSKMRYVNVREFRGKIMVDIREYYDSDGDLKPGRKGICLNMEQWNALKEQIDSIDQAVKRF
ncbi:activated RNA polymerase II transcriptional coactivator p15-like isoform X2 [Uloborus diversus]|nr:activated RNA polymerase II transcriptional coactivator p15-like isoform X2 [Uloborus diversus]XP_054714605.1 activated RNA polymerase II transcriptional coactivator p15-like isoform X2 [Uloborus diversus]